jgi:hypothetical protein
MRYGHFDDDLKVHTMSNQMLAENFDLFGCWFCLKVHDSPTLIFLLFCFWKNYF